MRVRRNYRRSLRQDLRSGCSISVIHGSKGSEANGTWRHNRSGGVGGWFHRRTPGYGAYNASKAAMRSFAQTWTNELATRGLRVNVASPGPTETPMMAEAS
ncbi:SDR family oxidoreductase [Acidisarcina polymorpha]|uniref:SDR family oxidoreductase n=1 Tax=Acidisarcina polymorpha TaxID=2211140 RepID=UPI00191C452F